MVWVWCLSDDADVNSEGYCQQALTLFEKFRNFYNPDHVDSAAVIERRIKKIEALKLKKSPFEQVL